MRKILFEITEDGEVPLQTLPLVRSQCQEPPGHRESLALRTRLCLTGSCQSITSNSFLNNRGVSPKVDEKALWFIVYGNTGMVKQALETFHDLHLLDAPVLLSRPCIKYSLILNHYSLASVSCNASSEHQTSEGDPAPPLDSVSCNA